MQSLPTSIVLVCLAAGLGCSGAGGVTLGNGAPPAGSTASGSGVHGSTSKTAGGTSGATTTESAGTTPSASSGGSTSSAPACTNLQCQVQQCPNGGHTTISGTIVDPAGTDPLYNVVAYVPNSAVQPLPSGATCASCNSLFSGDPMADGLSDANGNFTIVDAPVGSGIPVILQVGKWRTHTSVNVTGCQDNSVGTIKFPSRMDSADGIINLPDIAVSTGGADSLECLLVRVGIDSSEYVPGNSSTAGKVHIFNGGQPGSTAETNPMAGAPNSDQALWSSATSLAAYDIVLLSCEGDETYDAMPSNLDTYLNTEGGRVFASHYHYAWFTGATEGQTPTYSSPPDWGSGGSLLANWSTGAGQGSGNSTNGDVVTSLWNGSAFPKGQALATWLGNVGALGTSGAGPAQLSILAPRENATVVQADTGSQPWITDPTNSSTLYFSFNTPLNANPLAEGSTCAGRAVFSGLHVGGASYDGVNCQGYGGLSLGCPGTAAPPPAGCDTSHGLSPQEKALEFMLFDLSSCVVPDTANPADAGAGPIFK